MDLSSYKTYIDSGLSRFCDSLKDGCGLQDSMIYSLLAGGKRIRPALVLEFSRLCGGDMELTLPVALSIELIHTYSLIHDDLPCMDDDDLRRGRPTNHIVYGEDIAVLAGDALQASAFSLISECSLPADVTVECMKVLSKAAGLSGMCGGQYLDIKIPELERDTNNLDRINILKTGALLSAACMLGTICGGATAEQINAASVFGEKIGLAFQIRDDMLDVMSSAEQLGKTIGSDASINKHTYFSEMGKDTCERLILSLTEEAKQAVIPYFDDCSGLIEFADKMAERTY